MVHSSKLALLACGLLPPLAPAAWETATHEGHSYVTARSVQEFYKFDTMRERDNFLVLETKAVECRLPTKGLEAFFNDIKVHLEFPLVGLDGKQLVSRVTLAKTIDPILRPRMVPADSKGHLSVIVVDSEPAPVGQGVDLTLKLAYAVRAKLEAHRFKVVVTRGDDPATLADRIKVINAAPESYVVSLRITNNKKMPSGIRTWVLAPEGVVGLDGERPLAGTGKVPANAHDFLAMSVAVSTHGTLIRDTRRPDRGVARCRDALLLQSDNPAALFEVGNLAHEEEATLLKRGAFQDTLAEALAEGVFKAKIATSLRGANE